jgi:chaperonin cofactor prefoldin
MERIQAMLKEIKDNQRLIAEHIYKQEALVRDALEDRAEKLEVKIDNIQAQVNSIKEEQSKGRETSLRYVISVVVSVCVGGLFEYLLRIK